MTTYSNIRYAAAGVTEYATADDLPTTAASGSQAFVAGTNRLYIWNGTGWYNIALINTNPTISGVSSSYSLAQDGTATTVTIVASDPEGIPITYSIASDTSGSIATVAQGTGASTNVFTITPSTSDANAGTFSLTFRASDGINIATAPAEFSLAFQVVNSNYTSALITSVGANNAVNNTFIDSSSNSHTITASGDATQTTFSPYRHGGYSLYFPGATTMDLGFSTLNSGNWTFECWAIIEAGDLFAGKYNGGNQLEGFGVSNTTGYMYTHTGAGVETPTCNTDLRDGKWHYLVWERYNGTYYYWADGSLETSFANTETPAGGGNWSLGGWSSGQMTGNIKEARLSLTTAVYSGSAPTTPTEPQTAAKSTDAFFTGVGLEVKDYSSNNRTFTVPAALELQATAPYDYNQYSSATNGGSIYFDGSGDYLLPAADAAFAVGTGDFTIEFWMYAENISGAENIWDQRTGAGFTINLSSSKVGFYSESSPTGYVVQSAALNNNKWYHVAFVRTGSAMVLYLNGVSVDTGTTASNYTDNSPKIGVRYTADQQYFTGYLSDIRSVKGTAVYASAFTPTTAPLTAITNTSLLLKGTNAGIIDKSQSAQTITLNGDVKSSTTAYKYLTSSMAFDGTGDYISIPVEDAFSFGTGDFTIEMWFQYSGTIARYPIILGNGISGSGIYSGWAVFTAGNTLKLDRYTGTQTTVTFGNFTAAADAWHHLAIARSGTTIRGFINGTQVGSDITNSVSYNAHNTDPLNIGYGVDGAGTHQWNGYMSDVRITKGLARYTAAFTPPTAALKG